MSWARAELSIYVCVLLWAGGVGNGVDGFFSVWFPFAIARNGNPRATSNDSITTDKKKAILRRKQYSRLIDEHKHITLGKTEQASIVYL